jgi:hypothetical protein
MEKAGEATRDADGAGVGGLAVPPNDKDIGRIRLGRRCPLF